MFSQAQIRLIGVFLCGVVAGVVAITFLGGREQITAAAQQNEATKVDQEQVGRYQAFKLEVPVAQAGLLDTTTGKLWMLQETGKNKWKWTHMIDGPK
jgi:hypothetical protein